MSWVVDGALDLVLSRERESCDYGTVEYTMKLEAENLEASRKIDWLNNLVKEIIIDEDPEKNGLFYCGKLLCSTGNEGDGLKLIEKCCHHESVRLPALLYLIEFYLSRKQWGKLLWYRRQLCDMGNEIQIVEFILNHQELYGRWCNKIIDAVICDGYFSNDDISAANKTLLVHLYLQHPGNIETLAENFPDDADFMEYIPAFFSALPATIQSNLDVNSLLVIITCMGGRVIRRQRKVVKLWRCCVTKVGKERLRFGSLLMV